MPVKKYHEATYQEIITNQMEVLATVTECDGITSEHKQPVIDNALKVVRMIQNRLLFNLRVMPKDYEENDAPGA